MSGLYLDHVLIAVRDLDQAFHTFTDRLGLKVTPEGVHPGRGTHNRLVVFGPEYLELISIYDAGRGLFRPNMAEFLESREGLFIFAMGTRDVDGRAGDLRDRGIAVNNPVDGSRRAEDGSDAYSWRQAEIDARETPGSQTFLIQHNRSVEERYTEPPEPATHAIGATGIHHIALAVRDADVAAARWAAAFGLATLSSERVGGREYRRVRLDLANSFLDFVSPLGPGPLSDFLARHGEAPYYLALKVEDLSAAVAYLAERGVPAGDETADSDGSSVMLRARHAQGVPLRLVQTGS